MPFDLSGMEAYFASLPPDVQKFIQKSNADISSPGELMLVGEYFRNSFGHTDEPSKKD